MDRKTAKQVKQFLWKYRSKKRELALIGEEINRLMESATDISVHLKEINVQTSGGDGFQSGVAAAIDKYNELKKAMEEEAEVFNSIIRAIQSVQDGRQRLVLTLRYINGYSWVRIAREMNYSEPEVYRFHKRALESIRRWLQENGKDDSF